VRFTGTMNALSPRPLTIPATSSEPLHHDGKRFFGALLALVVLLGGLGFWNDVFNAIDVTPPATKPQWKAALSKEELIDRWVRDRVEQGYGVEIVGRSGNDIDVKYRAHLADGESVENERRFRFSDQGSLVSVEWVSGGRENVANIPVTAGPAISPAAVDFPWGVRAAKAAKMKAATVAKRPVAAMWHPAELSARDAQQELHPAPLAGARNSQSLNVAAPVIAKSVSIR